MSEWANRVYGIVDRMDARGFAALFAEDGWMRFGNAAPMRGRRAIEEGIAGFFATIAGLRHDFRGVWENGDDVIVEAEVTYTRKDGGQVTIPAVTIYRRMGGPIDNGRVFIDLAPLYA